MSDNQYSATPSIDTQYSAEASVAKVGIIGHSTALSNWLDLFRWVAAVAVLTSHIRHRVFGPSSEVPHEARSILYYIFSSFSSFGAPAIVCFFVLSGFLVGGSSLRRFRDNGGFDAKDYFIARLVRLWVVLIPIFLISIAINAVGVKYGGTTGVYPIGLDGHPQLSQGFGTFACNALFLQTVACDQFALNGALWSLFEEFWYYVAWVPVMIGLWSKGPVWRRGIWVTVPLLGLLVLAIFQRAGPNVLIYFSVWLLGVVAAERRRPLIDLPVPVAALSVLASLVVWRIFALPEVGGTNTLYELPFDLANALSFTNLIIVLKNKSSLARPPLSYVHQALAGFSFTLYCLHTPILNCFGAVFSGLYKVGWHMVPRGTLPYALFVFEALFCLVSAYLVSLLFERHTQRIRAFVSGRRIAR